MTPEPIHITKVGLAVVKDRKLLMVRNGKHKTMFSTLGGKIEAGEGDVACLRREVREEAATEVALSTLKFLGEFTGAVLGHDNTFVTIRLYAGELLGEPVPSSEIVEVRYFDSTIAQEHLTPASEKVFAWLKAHDYID